MTTFNDTITGGSVTANDLATRTYSTTVDAALGATVNDSAARSYVAGPEAVLTATATDSAAQVYVAGAEAVLSAAATDAATSPASTLRPSAALSAIVGEAMGLAAVMNTGASDSNPILNPCCAVDAYNYWSGAGTAGVAPTVAAVSAGWFGTNFRLAGFGTGGAQVANWPGGYVDVGYGGLVRQAATPGVTYEFQALVQVSAVDSLALNLSFFKANDDFISFSAGTISSTTGGTITKGDALSDYVLVWGKVTAPALTATLQPFFRITKAAATSGVPLQILFTRMMVTPIPAGQTTPSPWVAPVVPADSASANLIRAGAASDSVSGGDAAAAGLSYDRSASDGPSATDAAALAATFAPAVTDPVAAGDQAVGVATYGVSAALGASVTDAATGIRSFEGVISDTLLALDGAVHNSLLVLEVLTGEDQAAASMVRLGASIDALAGGDAAGAQASAVTSVSDPASAGDQIVGATTISVAAALSAGTDDAATVLASSFVVLLAENVTGEDASSATLVTAVLASLGAGLGDGAGVSVVASVTASDPATAGDVTIGGKVLADSASDTATVTDSSGLLAAVLDGAVRDGVTGEDWQPTATWTTSAVAVLGAAASDLMTAGVVIGVASPDSASLLDLVAATGPFPADNLSDPAASGDLAAAALVIGRSVTESVSGSDSSLGALVLTQNFLEEVPLSDSGQAIATVRPNWTESIVAGDPMRSVLEAGAASGDTLEAAENLGVVVAGRVGWSEPAAATDASTVIGVFVASLFDAVPATDRITVGVTSSRSTAGADATVAAGDAATASISRGRGRLLPEDTAGARLILRDDLAGRRLRPVG